MRAGISRDGWYSRGDNEHETPVTEERLRLSAEQQKGDNRRSSTAKQKRRPTSGDVRSVNDRCSSVSSK